MLDRATHVARALSVRSGPSVVVSNEVGMGVVPDHPLGREYRDLLGVVNRIFAASARRAVLVVAGRALPLDDPHRTLS